MDNNTQKQQESYTSQSVIENGQPNAKSNSKKILQRIINVTAVIVVIVIGILVYRFNTRYERAITNHDFEIVKMSLEDDITLKDLQGNSKSVWVWAFTKKGHLRSDIITEDGKRFKGEDEGEYYVEDDRLYIDGAKTYLSKSGKDIKVKFKDGAYYVLRPLNK